MLVELPYFHKGPTKKTGLKLVRLKLGGVAKDLSIENIPDVWNLVSDSPDFSYSTYICYCPRCGRKLTEYSEEDMNVITSELNEKDCIII